MIDNIHGGSDKHWYILQYMYQPISGSVQHHMIDNIQGGSDERWYILQYMYQPISGSVQHHMVSATLELGAVLLLKPFCEYIQSNAFH